MDCYNLYFRICYEHETEENSIRELDRVKSEIEALKKVEYFKDEFPNLPFIFLPIDSLANSIFYNRMYLLESVFMARDANGKNG